jgi:hypothetical protein
MSTRRVRDEDLKVGDSVKLIGGWYRIVAIEPYEGPLVDHIFAVAQTDRPPVGFSLEWGGYTEVLP